MAFWRGRNPLSSGQSSHIKAANKRQRTLQLAATFCLLAAPDLLGKTVSFCRRSGLPKGQSEFLNAKGLAVAGCESIFRTGPLASQTLPAGRIGSISGLISVGFGGALCICSEARRAFMISNMAPTPLLDLLKALFSARFECFGKYFSGMTHQNMHRILEEVSNF